jgi:hypothetical protein
MIVSHLGALQLIGFFYPILAPYILGQLFFFSARRLNATKQVGTQSCADHIVYGRPSSQHFVLAVINVNSYTHFKCLVIVRYLHSFSFLTPR